MSLIQTAKNQIHFVTEMLMPYMMVKKKQKVLDHLKKLSLDIVFLQELHFKQAEIQFLK